MTNALRTIEKTSKDESEVIRRKTELVQYMGWRTAERTLKAYEHVNRGESFITDTLTAIHAALKRREDAIRKDPSLLREYGRVEPPSGTRDRDGELALLTGVYSE
ncbi:MAG: hypothetical protein LC130_03915 [Bryobacterales bacterium]|nr:hypothetical protein [Bryobacterales bacterium]